MEDDTAYESFIAGALWQAEQAKVLEECLEFIGKGCLVPPDGGQPCLEDAIESAKEALKKYRESK